MRRIFTEYLRSLDPRGEPPAPEAFRELCRALGRALKSELKKRGLWESPPSFLGIYGWQSWSGAGSGEDPLDELLAECYVFIFVHRLPSLKAHLKVKPNVDGLIFLNLRNFLHDRQRQHDPLGLHVFEVLRSAVRRAVRAGELHVLAGDSKIRNDSLLGFAPDAERVETPSEELNRLAGIWNDELLPELATARGKALDEVVRRLRRRLPELESAGVRAFRFKSLIDPLKNDARVRWAAILEHSGGESALEVSAVEDGDAELASVVGLVRPDTRVEDRESFEKLVACVDASLERLATDGTTRGYLSTLWQFLKDRSAETADGVDAPRATRRAPAGSKKDGLLSRRKTAELLKIPRDRLPGLYEILGQRILSCRESLSGAAPATSRGRGKRSLGAPSILQRGNRK